MITANAGTHEIQNLARQRLNSTTRARPDPRGPARTLSEIRTDPTEFLGDPGREKVRAGPVGSGRVRVVEFSLKCGRLADTPDSQLAE